MAPGKSGTGGPANSPDDRGNEQASNEAVVLETEGFDPSYDPATVLNRVERLRDLDATGHIRIHEYDADARNSTFDMRDTYGDIRRTGAHVLQLYSNASAESRRAFGYTVARQDAVHVYLLNESDLRERGVSQDVVLAHEFVHALQYQRGLLSATGEQLRSNFARWTTDAALVTRALVEGDATWVTEQYFRRYAANRSNYSVTDYNRTLARAAWPSSIAGTVYYYGYRYFAKTGSSPAARSAAIERPPDSTAELLHPGGADERAPLPAPPDPSLDANLTRHDNDTVGELVVRHALRMNGLSFSRAVDAAEGWVNGRMYYYLAVNAEGSAIHWVTAWESEREAREFADAWWSMLDANGARPVGDTLFVPAGDHAPGVYYVVEREGDVVRITAAQGADAAERLARTAENAPGHRRPGTSLVRSPSTPEVPR